MRINRLAQSLDSEELGFEWFDSSSEQERNEIMKALDLCIFQSHPTSEDIEQGIKKSGLKETFSPCVLVRKRPFNAARRKVLGMTDLDQKRAFRLFMAIFSVADERRRKTQCKNGCTHDWHNLQAL